MKKAKYFANGFESWMETFYEIVEYITLERQKDNDTELFKDIQENQGSKGFWILAEQWADEFENLNKGRNWEDGDFYDEIVEFCKKKNNDY